MTDYFELLGEARRPWIDPVALKEKFVALSREAHPDKVRGEGAKQYADLNAAYQCLRHSKERLAHLIELETGSRPQTIQAVPAGLTEFFMEMTHFLREIDAFAPGWSTASALLKAQLFPEAQRHIERLQQMQGEINSRLQRLEAELVTLNSRFPPGKADKEVVNDRLAELYGLFSYYSRWSSQLQERLTALAL